MNMKQDLHSLCVFYLADGSAKWYSLDSGSPDLVSNSAFATDSMGDFEQVTT